MRKQQKKDVELEYFVDGPDYTRARLRSKPMQRLVPLEDDVCDELSGFFMSPRMSFSKATDIPMSHSLDLLQQYKPQCVLALERLLAKAPGGIDIFGNSLLDCVEVVDWDYEPIWQNVAIGLLILCRVELVVPVGPRLISEQFFISLQSQYKDEHGRIFGGSYRVPWRKHGIDLALRLIDECLA